MKSKLNRKNVTLRKDEAGYALMWVLVVIILAGIILVPLFLLMTAGLTSSHLHEERMLRFYAADAGIEDAIYRVIHEKDPTIPDPDGQLLINGSTVDVTITADPVEDNTYKITSTATDDADGKSTTVESYVQLLVTDLAGLFDNAITSNGNVTIQPGTVVEGNVQHGGVLIDRSGSVSPEEDIAKPFENWPTAELLSSHYLEQVDVSNPFPSDTIDLKTYVGNIGPLYSLGSLTIKSTTSEPRTGTIGGTVYLTGDMVIGLSGGKGFTIDLNGQTIYAEGSITVMPNCTITGSGCIIAVGEVDFQPTMASDEDDFVFIMSLENQVKLHPSGDFYGALVGNATVELQPNCTLTWRPIAEGEYLNFPTEVTVDLEVLTYTIE